MKKVILYILYFIVLNLIPYVPIKDCWSGFNTHTFESAHWCEWTTCQPSLMPCLHTEGSTYLLGITNGLLAQIVQIILLFGLPYLLTWLTIHTEKKIKKYQ